MKKWGITLIPILPEHYGSYDCYLNNLIGPVSKYWNICHLPVLWAEFDFVNGNYNPKDIDGISISVGSIRNRETIWREYCGISLSGHKCRHFDEFMDIAVTNLKVENPIAVTIDSHDVPWNEYLQFRHHCILICGMDEYSGTLFCSDGSFHPKGICSIDARYLFKHSHTTLLFKHVKVERKGLSESLDFLMNIIKQSNSRKWEDMGIFLNCVSDCWDMANTGSTQTDMSNSSFLLDLACICNSRHNFVKGLLFFYQEFQTDIFSDIIAQIIDLCRNWDSFKGLYIRSTLSGKRNYMEKAVDILSQINEDEKEITRNLLRRCGEGLTMSS